MSVPRNFLIYGIGGAGSRFAAILLVPLYTRTLSVAQFGLLEILLALHALATLLSGMQSESAVARDYFEAEAEGKLAFLKWGSAAITLAGTCLLTLVGLIAVELGLLPGEIGTYFPWLVAMTLPAQLLGIQLVLLRFAGSPILFAVLSFVDLALAAVASAVFILVLDMGVVGALAGIALAKTVTVLLAWKRSFGSPGSASLSLTVVQQMLSYSLPTMPAVLLNWLQTNGTRVLLALFLTIYDVAIAAIAIKVAAVYGFLTYSFRLAWEPYAFQQLSAVKQDPAVYNRAFQWYVATMFLGGGLAAAASPMLVFVLAPPEYSGAVELTTFFVVGQFWIGAIAILAMGIHGARVTSRLTIVYAVGAMLNVLILALLAGSLGVTAAGVGFAASAMISALLAARYSDKHFAIRFDNRLLAVSLCATSAFAVAGNRIYASTSWTEASVGQYLLTCLGVLGALAAAMLLVLRFGFGPSRTREMWRELPPLMRVRV